MTREVYDKVCRLLTEYEHPEENPDWFERNWQKEFYLMLVKVQNDSEYA